MLMVGLDKQSLTPAMPSSGIVPRVGAHLWQQTQDTNRGSTWMRRRKAQESSQVRPDWWGGHNLVNLAGCLVSRAGGKSTLLKELK